ncbi:sec-independent protein translocase protein TatC [Motilibacter rhizosphaerae]|uniref:Sec-independent protein translocase protein TatC n=1 Tax=Motilibacter rhizosphaerae TaxID=598652 RepID=A0A4Q7NBU3_9ACTN|nr:twin-arginine translocase subunit TatC [Motilibacter rhizosphaerae]RZS80087.1 sec-independent protein translocase protein TatC [Motilibacter rhizosphaerae]
MTSVHDAPPQQRRRARVPLPPLRRKRERNPGGQMALIDHLRELRRRIVLSMIAAVPGAVIGLVFYQPISHQLVQPMCNAHIHSIAGKQCLVQNGITQPFNTALAIAVVTGILLATPVWLYQLWAFVTPGLHANERRWSIAFLATSIPLFFSGAALAYWLLPKAIDMLLSFTISDAANLVELSDYLSLLLRMILVFGLAFEMPVFIAMLNAAGILPGRTLIKAWRYVIFAIFVFAAVATPTGDPFTMLTLALPMCVLFLVSYAFCVWNDRRRARRAGEWGSLDDDEASPLDETPSALDETRSPLDDTPSRLDWS